MAPSAPSRRPPRPGIGMSLTASHCFQAKIGITASQARSSRQPSRAPDQEPARVSGPEASATSAAGLTPDQGPARAAPEASAAVADDARVRSSRWSESVGHRRRRAAADAGLFGNTSSTLVRSSQSSSGPAGGAPESRWLRAGTRSCGPGPGHSESSFRTDPSVCLIMLRHRYR